MSVVFFYFFDIIIIGENMIEVRNYRDTDLDSVNIILKEAFNESKRNFKNSNFKEIVVCVDGKVAGYLLLTRILNPVKEKSEYDIKKYHNILEPNPPEFLQHLTKVLVTRTLSLNTAYALFVMS